MRFFFIAAVVSGSTGIITFFCVKYIFATILQTHAPRILLAIFGLFWLLHLAIPFMHHWLKHAFLVLGFMGFGGLASFVLFSETQGNSAWYYLGVGMGCYFSLVMVVLAGRRKLMVNQRDIHQWGEDGLRSLQGALEKKEFPLVDQIYRKGDALRLVLALIRESKTSGEVEWISTLSRTSNM